ncbi:MULTISPECIES: TnsA endonuclease N-terminal domain-containing protein [Methylomonas]|uniref:Transposase n=2 Tax=Methylomonas TaxID=416 RepID=A0A126T4C1_9GAMM|nr:MULTISPECIES: TnsA endonuclease N-terminal domain-containing protein [Methylomonas]AMK76918.1 transposase [Methylomonas denitrificans]OAH97546.1 transposase [Methylomonas methanica]TCV73880.1 TnsA endonuclease-like protein [Methylomonas methanica]
MSKNLWQGAWRGCRPDGDVHKRARNIITPSGGIVRGKFPSRKNGRMVHHEGLLELEAIYLFETSPNIVRYREQPVTIHYPDDARLRRYTPDFELVLATGEIIFIEVKPTRSLQHGDVQHKLDRVAEYMRRSETTFVILTDQVIRQEPRLSNLRWIYHRASRVPPTPDALTVAINQYRSRFPLSLTAAANLFDVGGIDPYSLLLAGHLRCSLEQPISHETLITIDLEADNGWFCIAQEYGF